MKQTVLILITGCCLASPATALGQGAGTWEFGVDAGFNLSLIDDVDDDLLTIGVPASDFSTLLQNFRVGYNLTEQFEVEPAIGFSYYNQGGETFWRLGFSLDGLYNLPGEGDTRWFLRGGGLISVIGGSSDTLYQLGLGAGGGVRLGLGSQWGLRLEAGGARLFENDDFYGRWDITGSVGFSFFTS